MVGQSVRLFAVVLVAAAFAVPTSLLGPGTGVSSDRGSTAGVASPTAPIAPSGPLAGGLVGGGTARPTSTDPCSLTSDPSSLLSSTGGPGPNGTQVAGGPSLAPAGSSIDPTAATIASQAVAAGACTDALFLPRASATAGEVQAAADSGSVRPLYNSSPAPTGVADYGLSVNATGSIVASTLATTSLWGIFDPNATGVEPMDLYNQAPDSYSVQLNAVLTGVTLFGRAGYEYWTQDVLEFYPAAHELFLITNVWNFSGSAFLGGAIYAHGPHGAEFDDEVYIANVSFTGISYPFNASLYLNSTIVGGRDAVDFTATLDGPRERVNAPFDYVVFNSIGAGGPPLTAPADFVANGSSFDPIGLTNDFELDIGGPGDGSQATLMAADAALGLAYWNASLDGGAGAYESVPAAFSFGGETGETSNGGTVTWSDAPGGPGGLGTYAVLRTGPQILSGLWNASGPEGAEPVTLESSVPNAFEVVTPQPTSPLWSLLPGAEPGFRSEAMEAYSPPLGATILFGGYNPYTQRSFGDTWEFRDDVWTNVTEPGGPPARQGGVLVYDAADQYLLLFGGRTATGTGGLGDTWIYNASGWHELFPSVAPSPRAFFAMAYDPALSEVVLTGGGLGGGDSPWTLYSDTWTYRAGVWTNITATAGTGPGGRLFAGLAPTPGGAALLLVGGSRSRDFEGAGAVACPFTFPTEWTFTGGAWTEVRPTGAVPPPGSGSLWYDTETGGTYYYEGVQNLSSGGGACESYVGVVYSYTAGHWTDLVSGEQLLGSASPAPRWLATVVDDQASGQQLLYGGQQGIDGPFFDSTWALQPRAATGSTWIVGVQPTVGPTVTTDTFWLPPGNYSVTSELSDYDPVTTDVAVSGPMTVEPTLAPDPALGIYTPLWAWSDGGLAALATGGDGAPADPYVLTDYEPGLLDPTFGLYNDYSFPVYPGMFLLDTRASVEVESPPAFEVSGHYDGLALQFDNSLPLWFWNVSGVALLNSTGLGIGETVLSALGPFAAAFYDSSGNLIAGNTITAREGGILAEAGPTPGPFTGNGGGNTFWGNRFHAEMGLVELDHGDEIYNNAFLSGENACQPGDSAAPNDCWPVYAVGPESFQNSWNITPAPAGTVHYAAGFPTIPLSGSILGTADQGGNSWWNYGSASDPLGVLPFNNTPPLSDPQLPLITPGGDFDPLIVGTLYPITFEESGLPARVRWGADIEEFAPNCSVTSPDWAVHTQTASFVLLMPNGSVEGGLVAPPGYSSGPPGVDFNVVSASRTVSVRFFLTYTNVTFVEGGLPAGLLAQRGWYVELDGYNSTVHTTSARLEVETATVPYLIVGPKGYRVEGISPSGDLELAGGNTTLALTFAAGRTDTLTFSARGLHDGQYWCAELGGSGACTVGRRLAFANLTPGTYVYNVSGSPGQAVTARLHGAVLPANGTVSLAKSERVVFTFTYPYNVTFYETGLAAALTWSVRVAGVTYSANADVPISVGLPNGSYRFHVGAEAGYRVHASPAAVRVRGGPATVVVSFRPHDGARSAAGQPAAPPAAAASVSGVAARPAGGAPGALVFLGAPLTGAVRRRARAAV